MLRPQLNAYALTVGTFVALNTMMSPSAHAVLTLSLDDGGGPTVVTDDDGDGILEFGGSLSTFDVNRTTIFSEPFLEGTPAVIHLDSVHASDGPGTLTIEVTDTDFTFPSSYINFGIGGVTDGEVTYEAFVSFDNDDDPFLGTLVGSGDASTLVNAGTFSDTSRIFEDLDGTEPYSLGIRVTIEHGSGRKITSIDSEIRVPEPGSLGLLGTGLVLAGMILHRRRRRTRR